ncbi:hypothetical protein C6P45_002176 [Maudiozyma exigua]|uniref:Uncharacterized protein n=1 Tax=Maudiozyma exigua TaxID=34358 RepID=A0A9P6W015_MAUEX|nr:hypothetical protein C6P45_002176 [Kazachstania exigua]
MIHRHGYSRVSSQESILSQVSNWEQYRQYKQTRSQSNETPPQSNQLNIHHYIKVDQTKNKNLKRRHSSKRVNDFTSKEEINKNKGFLFPRGFIKLYHHNKNKLYKDCQRRNVKSRYQNVKELQEMMNFINLTNLETEQILPNPRIMEYNVSSLHSRQSQIMPSSTIPRNIYKRQDSIKRRIYIPMNETQVRLLNLKRSYSMPTRRKTYQRHKMKQHPENDTEDNEMIRSQKQLHSLWTQYLRTVIHQRIQLRLELMKVQSISTLANASVNNNNDTIRRLNKGETRENPIVIPDEISMDSRRKIY